MSLIRYFSLDNKTPFHDPLFHLYSGCSAKFAAGYTEQPFFVLFDGLCLSVGAILAGDDQA
jgi:hypothetical protein